MSEYIHKSHNVTVLMYHLVFPAKYRRVVFDFASTDECSAHLDSLMALGQAKSQYYAEKINTSLLGAGQGTDKTFPISSIQSFIYQTKAYTSDNAKNISSVINDSIKGFVSGDTTSAVTTMVSGFVDILFGSAEGSESEILRYCAILEGVSMIRLDFAGWSLSYIQTIEK
jgi:hypothetical protein